MTGRRASPAWFLASMLVLAPAPSTSRAELTATEYELKAAFLYNFARFVRWPGKPDSAAEAFPICVLGTDPFGELLPRLVRGRKVDDLPIVIRRVSDVERARRCRILFISPSERDRIATIVAAVRDANVLTVGEGEGFARGGGMIGFRLEGGRVTLEINRRAADEAGLEISSQLLKLAVIVAEEERRHDPVP